MPKTEKEGYRDFTRKSLHVAGLNRSLHCVHSYGEGIALFDCFWSFDLLVEVGDLRQHPEARLFALLYGTIGSDIKTTELCYIDFQFGLISCNIRIDRELLTSLRKGKSSERLVSVPALTSFSDFSSTLPTVGIMTHSLLLSTSYYFRFNCWWA